MFSRKKPSRLAPVLLPTMVSVGKPKHAGKMGSPALWKEPALYRVFAKVADSCGITSVLSSLSPSTYTFDAGH